MSGDVEASVSYYKELFKLDFAYWALKPNDKAELMKGLQGKGHKATFVGDGINDAPAIGVANVGWPWAAEPRYRRRLVT